MKFKKKHKLSKQIRKELKKIDDITLTLEMRSVNPPEKT